MSRSIQFEVELTQKEGVVDSQPQEATQSVAQDAQEELVDNSAEAN